MGHASSIWSQRLAASFVFGSLVVTGFDAQAADKLLVLQKATNDNVVNSAGPDAQEALQTASGTTVKLVQDFSIGVPADVASYSQVYLISIGVLPDPEAAKLVTYVKGGGSLFVSGERPDVANDPAIALVQDKLLKQVLLAPGELRLGTGESGGDAGSAYDTLQLGGDRGEFSLHPQELESLLVGDPGVVDHLPSENVFARDSAQRAIGALWTRNQVVGRGCVMLLMDTSFWSLPHYGAPETKADVATQAANIFDYLKYCGDHDLDGVTDYEERANGTDPDVPDNSLGGAPSTAGAGNEPAGGAAEPTGGTPSATAGSPPSNDAGGADTSTPTTEGGADGTVSGNGASHDDGGCGCRTAEPRGHAGQLTLSALIIAATLLRRLQR